MIKYNPPKWKYHRDLPAVQVKDDVEEAGLGAGWSDAYIFKKYPKFKYRPAKNKDGQDHFEAKVVASTEDEEKLGSAWHDSPAHFGVETTPGLDPDQSIAAKKSAGAASVVDKKAEAKKAESKKMSEF